MVLFNQPIGFFDLLVGQPHGVTPFRHLFLSFQGALHLLDNGHREQRRHRIADLQPLHTIGAIEPVIIREALQPGTLPDGHGAGIPRVNAAGGGGTGKISGDGGGGTLPPQLGIGIAVAAFGADLLRQVILGLTILQSLHNADEVRAVFGGSVFRYQLPGTCPYKPQKFVLRDPGVVAGTLPAF